MTAFVHSETFWLQLTNFGLAAACVLAMVVLAVAVIRDFGGSRRRLAEILPLDDGSNLGPTMADGGLPYTGPEDCADSR
jgi:hypothetical protein